MNSWSNMKITYMTISGNSLDAKKKKINRCAFKYTFPLQMKY